MEEALKTFATILGTGIVIIGGYVLQDWLQGKRELRRQVAEKEREIREAKRKDREGIVKPIRDALGKAHRHQHRESRIMIKALEEAKAKGAVINARITQDIEQFIALDQRTEGDHASHVLAEVIPLVASITNSDVRTTVETALLACGMTEEARNLVGITDTDFERRIREAYAKLEDYVALVDLVV